MLVVQVISDMFQDEVEDDDIVKQVSPTIVVISLMLMVDYDDVDIIAR